jgi:glycerate kinase
MKIVIAPDKFKGALDARQVAEQIALGLRDVRADLDIDLCPIADGGDGTVTAMVSATHGKLLTARVTGPLPEMKVDATYGILGDGQTAVIEMAAASGLVLLKPEDRNPLNTTTFGAGGLLVAAARQGVNRIILGVGGSATTDAGIGCAQAAGLPVLLEEGEPVSPTEPLCGRDMPKVVLIKHGRGSEVERVKIVVACDVTNPLFGPNGAAVIFGPQKGATPRQVEWLDHNLEELARRTGKLAEANTPGAGAAGGLAFGMLAYFGAEIRPGAPLVLEAVKLRERLAAADLCITGEGQLDSQSLSGKAPIAVARLCKELGVPCVAFVGKATISREVATGAGIDEFIEISDSSMSIDACLRRTGELLKHHASRWLAAYRP